MTVIAEGVDVDPSCPNPKLHRVRESAEERLGIVHENLEGWIPALSTEAEIREALEKAFDYRGDLTITLKDGQKIEGYVFDRKIKGPALSDCFVRLMPKDRPGKLSDSLQRYRRARFHRSRHRRRKELCRLGEEVQRKESRRRNERRHRLRTARLTRRRGTPDARPGA